MPISNNNFMNTPPFGGDKGKGGKGGPERIKIEARCPACGSMYDFGRLEVVQEEEGATLMYIQCAVCRSATLSLIAFGSFGLKVASMLTDLERNEVASIQDRTMVRSEDVLRLHEDLKKTDNWLEQIN